MASWCGHTNVVDVLLKAGADVNEACTEVLLLLLILVFIRLLIINFVCCANVICTLAHGNIHKGSINATIEFLLLLQQLCDVCFFQNGKILLIAVTYSSP